MNALIDLKERSGDFKIPALLPLLSTGLSGQIRAILLGQCWPRESQAVTVVLHLLKIFAWMSLTLSETTFHTPAPKTSMVFVLDVLEYEDMDQHVQMAILGALFQSCKLILMDWKDPCQVT